MGIKGIFSSPGQSPGGAIVLPPALASALAYNYSNCYSYPSFQVSRYNRVAKVREKYLENKIVSRSGKRWGILWMAKEV